MMKMTMMTKKLIHNNYYDVSLLSFVVLILVMTNSFDSLTQYDKSFDKLFEGVDYAMKGFSCAWFTLLTACKFLNGMPLTKDLHNSIVLQSVEASKLLGSVGGIQFSQLIDDFTDMSSMIVTGTSSMLIKEKVIGYNEMFDQTNCKPYCVMFLKNEKYFLVCVSNGVYMVRDCHEKTQYDFSTLNELIKYLDESHQFSSQLIVGGLEMEEYNSIEFAVITKSFETVLTGLLNIDNNFSQVYDILGDNDSEDDVEYVKAIQNSLHGVTSPSQFVSFTDSSNDGNFGMSDFVDFDVSDVDDD
jgi:hypothetical protein